MADPRFFGRAGPLTLGEIARRSGAELGGGADPERLLHDVAPLDAAGPDDLSFLDNRKYVDAFAASRAAAVFVRPELAARAPAAMALLLTPHPYKAYALAAQSFYPERAAAYGVAATAVIDPTARLGRGVEIGHHVVIGAGAELGDRCRVGHNSVIGEGVVVGADTRVHPNCTLSHCLVGPRCTIFPGVRIGQDGFGFAPDPAGHVRVPQLGRVLIGADVEIGANSTVDRGAGPDTVLADGVRIDNLVQIAHNAVIGRGSILAAQVGVSGSTRLGEFVMAGGQAGFIGHLTIGSSARISAQSGVLRDLAPGESVTGFPAVPSKEYFRQIAVVQRLARKRVT